MSMMLHRILQEVLDDERRFQCEDPEPGEDGVLQCNLF